MENVWQWVAYGLIMILFGLIGVIFIRWRMGRILGSSEITLRTLPHRIGEFIFAAIIVFGVTVILGETTLLSKIYHRQIFRFFISNISDPKFLRETLTKEKLRELRFVVSQAVFGPKLQTGPGSFLDVLENKILPTLDQPMRHNLEVYYVQEVEELQGQRVLKVVQIVTCTYKNPFESPIEFCQPIENTLPAVRGIDVKDLLKVTKFMVNGENLRFDLEIETVDTSEYKFSGKECFSIEDSVHVEMEIEKIMPYRSDRIYFFMQIPTQNMKFTYKYPETFKIQGWGFGMEDKPAKQDVDKRGFAVWNYQGWLFKNQGFFVYWSVPGTDTKQK